MNRLQLELTGQGDSVSGTLSLPNGLSRPFDGWLDLLAALEQVLGNAAADGAPPP